jgi:hypothetical protein
MIQCIYKQEGENKMKTLMRINTGKAVHEAESWISENGKTHYSVGCGASKSYNRDVFRKAGKDEVVTCKKCLARMENKVEAVEMSEEEQLKEIYKKQQAKKQAPKVDKYEGMTMKEIYKMQHGA